ncbi:class I SAM-dependent methyltransferase [Nocardia sp. BMG51109]|uniref:class I SAM-dependent DNA methyltransferase n=1 Tax=Nocardia sp. BMG51109 TaxID=1056816 RepID=UPI000466B489|nr:class I SAM-dependent methyltransferase [Nocardia sp. BMG51109]
MTGTEDVRRTRDAYDDVAELYAATFEHALADDPFDRAMLGAFAELARGGGTVADIGCGPGRITGHLAELGLDVFGIDLSPEMIRLARAAHPALRFEVGSMTEPAAADGALGAIVAWYSIIHIPPERLPGVVAGFHRALADRGHLLLAYQAAAGPDAVLPHDHRVAPSFLWSPDRLERLLRDGGFRVVARMVREPERDREWERHPQAYLLAEKSSAS